MTQKIEPWLSSAYGWNYGEGGWNIGMDENLLKFSYLFDRNVDGIVSTLPAGVHGQAYYLTTDNRIYFFVDGNYKSTKVPKWFKFFIKSTGETWQFNGTSAVEVPTESDNASRLDAVDTVLASLGSAAYEDSTSFSTQGELDVIAAQAASYTDELRTDLESPAGSGLVGFDDNQIYPAGTVGYKLKNTALAGFSYESAPSPYELEAGVVIGDQRYDAGTIGAGSIIMGGWQNGSGMYNRLPGTRNLRMILGGYDNEITAGTAGDDGGLACVIVGSHHSHILDAATHASVWGGSNHQMRGDYSAFVGGTLNEGVVGADFAMTGGLRAKTRWGGSHTMGMGFTNPGDMQIATATLRALTTDGTAKEMTTTSATTSRPSIAANSTMVFEIMIAARRIDTGDETAAYHIRGAVKRGADVSSTALIGTPTVTVLGETDASWNVAVGVSTAAGVLQVLVYGAAGKTIRWGGRIDMAEVTL